ncbi:MAG: hypothetical protein ISS65_01055 [Desulfobacterales bacterium]|uniref:Uncharacterized protein n=1 Tax=Candidatus Desulfatibia profunda TaxID=2841695 RepID=A0A8J6TGU8_9BACT|nr:hypothetical protein [Candidatus Desulfatibia profunda]MBL7178786.1 hypothetical protein [Desulfobacterales bacterium]
MDTLNLLKSLTCWVDRLSTKSSLFETLWASLSASDFALRVTPDKTTQQVGLAEFTESAAL